MARTVYVTLYMIVYFFDSCQNPVYIYGSGVWFWRMVLVYGSGVWFWCMVLVYGSGLPFK